MDAKQTYRALGESGALPVDAPRVILDKKILQKMKKEMKKSRKENRERYGVAYGTYDEGTKTFKLSKYKSNRQLYFRFGGWWYRWLKYGEWFRDEGSIIIGKKAEEYIQRKTKKHGAVFTFHTHPQNGRAGPSLTDTYGLEIYDGVNGLVASMLDEKIDAVGYTTESTCVDSIGINGRSTVTLYEGEPLIPVCLQSGELMSSADRIIDPKICLEDEAFNGKDKYIMPQE